MTDPSDNSNTFPWIDREPSSVSSDSDYEQDVPDSFEDDPTGAHRHDAELYRDDEPSQTWDISHLMFAAVPAAVEITGIAKAAAAFSHRDGRPAGSFSARETFEMVSEFDDDVVEILEQQWGVLTPIERLDSEAGQRWVEALGESTSWNEQEDADGVGHLYTQFGDSITTREGSGESLDRQVTLRSNWCLRSR